MKLAGQQTNDALARGEISQMTDLEKAANAEALVGKTVWNGLSSFFTSCWQGIQNMFTTVLTAIKNVVTAVVGVIQSFVTAAWNGIKSVVQTVMNTIQSVVSSVAGDMVISPRLAAMEGAQMQMASVDSVRQMLSGIQKMFAGMQSRDNVGTICIPVYVGGTLLDEVVVNAQVRQNLR